LPSRGVHENRTVALVQVHDHVVPVHEDGLLQGVETASGRREREYRWASSWDFLSAAERIRFRDHGGSGPRNSMAIRTLGSAGAVGQLAAVGG